MNSPLIKYTPILAQILKFNYLLIAGICVGPVTPVFTRSSCLDTRLRSDNFVSSFIQAEIIPADNNVIVCRMSPALTLNRLPMFKVKNRH